MAPRYKLLALLTWFTLFILLKLLYTATTLACMPVYIVRKVRTLLEWPVELLSKMWTGWVMGDGYPLDCYDY